MNPDLIKHLERAIAQLTKINCFILDTLAKERGVKASELAFNLAETARRLQTQPFIWQGLDLLGSVLKGKGE